MPLSQEIKQHIITLHEVMHLSNAKIAERLHTSPKSVARVLKLKRETG